MATAESAIRFRLQDIDLNERRLHGRVDSEWTEEEHRAYYEAALRRDRREVAYLRTLPADTIVTAESIDAAVWGRK